LKRILGLDIGKVRIGVAVSDPLGSFAQGIAVIDATENWIGSLKQIISRYPVEVIVVGLPLRTDGSIGPEAEWVRSVIEELRAAFQDIEVLEWDERFTTTTAIQYLLEGDVSRSRRKKFVDKIAASIMLQGFLDNRRQ